MGDESYGLVDHWLAGIRDQVRRHHAELEFFSTESARFNRVVELDVLRQVYNRSRTPIVQSAWKRGRRPMLHRIVYDLHVGLLKQLVLQVDGQDKVRALLGADRRGLGYSESVDREIS